MVLQTQETGSNYNEPQNNKIKKNTPDHTKLINYSHQFVSLLYYILFVLEKKNSHKLEKHKNKINNLHKLIAH